MENYHINPKTGIVSVCNAVTGICPFGGPDEHYASYQDGQRMADFKNELASDMATALEHNPVEKVKTEHLRAYYRAVLNAFDKQTGESTQETVNANLREEIRKKLEPDFKEYRDYIEQVKKNFDTNNDPVLGLPKGLFKGIDRNLQKDFAKSVYSNPKTKLVHLDSLYGYEISERAKNLKQYKNFQATVKQNVEQAKKNVKDYQLTTITEEDIRKKEEEQIEFEYKLYKETTPVSLKEQAKSNKVTKKSNSDRKEILSKINKEISLRRGLDKFEDGLSDKITQRTEFKSIPTDQRIVNSLKNVSYSKEEGFDNVYLLTSKNTVYRLKSKGTGNGGLNVIDSDGVESNQVIKSSIKTQRLNSGFTLIQTETSKPTQEETFIFANLND